MIKIEQIICRKILNSKGNQTIETTVITGGGIVAVASVPSGTSVGKYEAIELKDVSLAIKNIENTIAPRLLGIEVSKQLEIDKIMIDVDGTQNKGRLGTNTILSVSMAVAKAAAKSYSLPLFSYIKSLISQKELSLKIPTPCFNLINGGKHAGGNLDLQEFLIIPESSVSYSESLQIGAAIQQSLKEKLIDRNLTTLVGDEGGFGPNLPTNLDALSLLKQSVEAVNFRVGSDIFFGIDCAASNFYKQGKYCIKDNPQPLSSKELIAFYQDLIKNYSLLYLEDPFSEDDWNGWSSITSKVSQETIIVGDDLTTTNPSRLEMAIDKKAITGIIIKPNQIGTITETIEVVEMARLKGLKIILSHRSGETNDDFIADFAVGVGADYVKFGALQRGERVAKYNRLLQIEEQMKVLKSKSPRF